MEIVYDCRKDIPCVELHKLFAAVGWSEQTISDTMLKNFNIGFLNSTIVFSAWSNQKLVGCIRVLSDQMFRSIIYDLVVLPEFQHKGIGKELIRRCMETYPYSEWLVQTDHAAGFYQKVGFTINNDVFLTIPSKWF